MTLYTQYAGIPVPESTDIADEPFTLQQMAAAIDDIWGGAFDTYTPQLIQGAGATKYITLNSTTFARVKKVGKTVYLQTRLDVSAGTGSAGEALTNLPYPAVSTDEPLGTVFCARGGAFSVNNWNIQTAKSNLVTVGCNNGVSSLSSGDFILLLLCYETSG